ncbi:MAG: cell division protein ZapA [Magnetococcales bacterium]|nr:cell division protein ZapA [Magnetococcales bacterium]
MTDTVEIRIYGHTFKVKATHGQEYIQDLATLVDGTMKTMAQHSTNRNTDRLAIMTALKMADDLQQLKQSHHRQAEAADQKVQALIEASDRLLEG